LVTILPQSIPTCTLAGRGAGMHNRSRDVVHKVHVGIVLDRSGSMEDCRTDAIGAVNSYLRQVKEDKDMEASVSLIIFDSQSIDVIRDHVPAAGCPELSTAEYQPRGGTPLFDAVGHGVSVLDTRKGMDDRCILAIMTDGLENASREYTKETLKALLDRKQNDEGWLVLYLGADHDAWSQASSLGLHACNVASFAKGSVHATAGAIYSRGRSYAVAVEKKKEARSGGFTAEQRQSMNPDNSSSKA
jgi:hypothetical protein